MDLDLDSDFNDLSDLQAPVVREMPSLEDERNADTLALAGIPEFGFWVGKEYSLDSLSLWKVRFLTAYPGPGGHYRNTKCRVHYTHVERIWGGPKAKTTGSHTMKDGRVISRYTGTIESFELNLLDALHKLGQERDRFRKDARNHVLSLRQNIQKMEEDIARQEAYLKQLDAFDPDACVPSDMLDEAELEMERALVGLR